MSTLRVGCSPADSPRSPLHRLQPTRELRRIPRRPADHQDGIVASNSADDLRQAGAIDRERERLSLPRVGPQHQELLDRLVPPQVFVDGTLKHGLCVDRLNFGPASPTVSPIRRAFDEPQLLDVSRQRRLRRLDAPVAEPDPELLLAGNWFLLNEFEDGGLPTRLHKYARRP